MQEEWYEPSRRAILRTNAYRSTPYGKECSERNLDEAHTVLERRIQRGEITLTAEQEAAHEAWRAKKGITRPPRREV